MSWLIPHSQWWIPKDTSELADIKVKKRNTLFFNKYEFCATAMMSEAFVLRHRDHASMDDTLSRRREWGRRMARQPGSWLWARLEITDDLIKNLHTALDWVLEQGDSIKVVASQDYLHVYAQDQALLEQIQQLPGVRSFQLSRATVVGSVGAINLRKSRYKNRTYFRYFSLTLEQKRNLKQLLRAQTDIRLGPGLDWWLGDNENLRLYEHHFLDHDDAGIVTMLSLCLGRVIRKTVPIKTY